MRLPEFTAEASLYMTSAKYRRFSTVAGRPDTSSVRAQFLLAGQEWWLGWWWFNRCPAGCFRRSDGSCFCYKVQA